MASLAARYEAGEYEAVWEELRVLPYLRASADPAPWHPSAEEADDILRMTFERVARNADRLVERLRETGYRFECETGRNLPPKPPRRPATEQIRDIAASLDGMFDDLPAFTPQHSQIAPEPPASWAPIPVGPMPRALLRFGEIVGSLDLKQRYPFQAALDVATVQNWPEDPGSYTDDRLSPEAWVAVGKWLRRLAERRAAERDPVEERRQAEISRGDAEPHPHAGDPVLSRLRDWDPLVVDIDWLHDQTATEEEAQMVPLSEGGLAILAEFAPSFEFKSNTSGAWNPNLALPFNGIDPVVRAEGIRMPFTTYLRRCFARGGFFGVPRPVRSPIENVALREVEPGIFLPDHPIFQTLAEGLEPF